MAFVLLAHEDCLNGAIPKGSYLVWNGDGFHIIQRKHLDCGALSMAWQNGELELIPQQQDLASLEAARLIRLCAGLPFRRSGDSPEGALGVARIQLLP